jgi:hypothetical protein
MQNPDAVISFNTDGIYATQRLQVDEGPALGQWEISELDWFISVQSGVYFYPDPKARGGVGEHFRGFDRGSISPQRVIEAWDAGQPVLECTLTRLVTLGQALHHPGDEAAFRRFWLTWRRAPRLLRLDLLTGKRIFLDDAALRQAARELVATQPVSNPTPDELSAAYRLGWDYQAGLLEGPDEEYDGTKLSAVLADLDS